MSIPLRSLLVAPLIAVWLLSGALGCGSDAGSGASDLPRIRAMKFAGADLEYALERIAAEAGMPLALDQIRTEDNTPDLGMYRVDLDLPPGPVDEALRELADAAGGIDFEIVNGVIYVRSNMLVNTKTPIDQPLLPKHSFKGDINALVAFVAKSIERSYVAVERVVGDPEPPVVEFEIADKASVRDILLQYAQASKLGWTMLRAGHVVADPKLGVAVVGTAIQLRYPRTSVSRRPQVFNLASTTAALAAASARLNVPMLVLDRSVIMNSRGFLNLSSQLEQQVPLEECLDDLAQSGWGPEHWHFKWKMDDGVPVIESRDYLSKLAGRDLLREELLAGEFEGSLPEFARWLNTHRKNPTKEVLMGGEIVEGQKRGKITVASGTTLQQALVMFARASGVGIHFVLLGSVNPLSGQALTHPNAWIGAYIQDLAEWIPTAEELQRSSGVESSSN